MSGGHSVYDYDPEAGAVREALSYGPVRRRPGFEDDRRTCAGCGERIEHGQELSCTVQQANHVITVYCHVDHWDAARANALADKSWQRDQSHSVYGYDPETGAAREPVRMEPVRPVTRYDPYRRCTCKHIKAHHRADEPYGCRMTTCECESFMPARSPG